MGNSTVGTTTVGSLVTNISTTGAATINIGNTGTSVTAGSIVNIGTGATGINIGNTGTSINLGKVRFTNPPVLAYYFTSAQTQSIPNGTDTTIKWPTLESRSGTGTGITYNSTTGVFTNSNSYSVVITLCASITYPLNSSGIRVLVVTHSALDRVAFTDIQTNALDFCALSTSSVFIMNAGETFFCGTYQTAGGALNLGGAATPNRISLLVM